MYGNGKVLESFGKSISHLQNKGKMNFPQLSRTFHSRSFLLPILTILVTIFILLWLLGVIPLPAIINENAIGELDLESRLVNLYLLYIVATSDPLVVKMNGNGNLLETFGNFWKVHFSLVKQR